MGAALAAILFHLIFATHPDAARIMVGCFLLQIRFWDLTGFPITFQKLFLSRLRFTYEKDLAAIGW